MRVAQILPGAGGTFYCQNCMRDSALVRSLRQRGVDVMMIPLYLPALTDVEDLIDGTPIFFGGINVFLQQKFGLFRKTPRWVDRFFDSSWMLRFAASQEGSTSAAQLGPMTLSMLQGRNGRQRKEMDRLMAWLKDQEKPDIVHVSNSLLLGVAEEIKRTLNVPVICSLQDEDSWLDAMPEPWAGRCWDVMSEKARCLDAFVTASGWFAGQMTERMGIPRSRITVVPVGIELEGVEPASGPPDPPVIGYLSRMSEALGLGRLADAFIRLKQNPRLRDLKLHVTGGHTKEDEAFLAELRAKLRRAGVEDDVEFFDDFQGSARYDFLRSLSVMSVPVSAGEAFGTFIIEALAFGVPVVQPSVGAFPEVLNATGGGILYEPEKEDGLEEALAGLLLEPERSRELGRAGRAAVVKDYNTDAMTVKVLDVYNSVIST